MSVDTDKLAKVLALTSSEHDGEALSAARHANAMVERAGLRWTDVIAAPRTAAASGTRAGAGGATGRRRTGFPWTTAAVLRLDTGDQLALVETLLRALPQDRSDPTVRYLSTLRAELRGAVRTSLARRQAEHVADLGRMAFG